MAPLTAEPDGLPSGEGQCAHFRGPAILDFEVEREGVPSPGTFLERLRENNRDRWRALAIEPGNRVLWREEEPDRFRYSVALFRRRTSSAIDVRRLPSGALWSHGHVSTGARLDCAIRTYSMTAEGDVGRLRERVELRSTSRLIRFYRHRMIENAVRAANEQLDQAVLELVTPAEAAAVRPVAPPAP